MIYIGLDVHKTQTTVVWLNSEAYKCPTACSKW